MWSRREASLSDAPEAKGMAVPLAVVVVNFNTRDHLRACLESVVADVPLRVVVADNGSSDGSVDMVRREFTSVEIDLDPANPGFGAAANRGIRRCAPADVLLLNSDTRLKPGALGALSRYLDEHPRAGIVGPRLVNPDGSLQRSCFPFPSPLRPPFAHDPLGVLARYVPGMAERCLATWSHDAPRVVPWVMGAAVALRREAFDAAGGFDESYFMYAEEIDFCFRLRTLGWETHFAPVTEVAHLGRASADQHRLAMLEQNIASSFRFYRRHYRGVRLASAEAAMHAGMIVRLLRDGARWLSTTDAARRHTLAENVGVWRRAMSGRLRVRGSS